MMINDHDMQSNYHSSQPMSTAVATTFLNNRFSDISPAPRDGHTPLSSHVRNHNQYMDAHGFPLN
jgi:ankyrin repeat protein